MRNSIHEAVAFKKIGDFCEIANNITNKAITSFHYSEIYDDKSRIFLTEDPSWFKCYNENYFSLGASAQLDDQKSGLIIWHDFIEQSIFRIAKKEFNIDPPIFLVNRVKNKLEITIFSIAQTINAYEFAYSNYEKLNKIRLYFKDKGQKIIKSTQIDRNLLPKSRGHMNVVKNKVRLSTELIEEYTNRFYIDEENNYLTKKEMLCIKHTIQGNSAKRVASILEISTRTVNEHLNNAREKLNAKTKFELIYKATKLNLI